MRVCVIYPSEFGVVHCTHCEFSTALCCTVLYFEVPSLLLVFGFSLLSFSFSYLLVSRSFVGSPQKFAIAIFFGIFYEKKLYFKTNKSKQMTRFPFVADASSFLYRFFDPVSPADQVTHVYCASCWMNIRWSRASNLQHRHVPTYHSA